MSSRNRFVRPSGEHRMFDASRARETQDLLFARMREEELRAAWRAANGAPGARRLKGARTPRLRRAVGATFIRIGQAVTELGRAVGRTEAT
jgi:hypothetical protein